MAIEGINNSVVNPLGSQVSSILPSSTSAVSPTSSASPTSVDVTVQISPQAQQLSQDNLALQTVAQTSDIDNDGDASSASEFGENATSNNATVAAQVAGSSGNTLNATPSNSSQSASVTSQYNISPESALGQTINFSV